MAELPWITSRKNAEIRAAVEIASSAKERRKTGLFFLEGARLCEDAAKSGIKIEKLFLTEEACQKYGSYIEPVVALAKVTYKIQDHVAEMLAKTKSSQGVFCLCQIPTERQGRLAGKWVALENVQDPANLGTVMRTAEALGFDGLVHISGCDLFSPKAVRASMGAVFRMQILTCAEVSEINQFEGIENMLCLAAVPDETAEQLGSVSYPNDTMIFIGNEGNGLTAEAIRFCKRKITIPMKGRAESLNAAAAAAICLWEISK
ncbi:TrmH family RNA methyltransferase [Scatolibacter rhodanostii]|uniref:TrmH family RNA methyltransferase n=1 Tax=Scatolibacter rhodanostii TaxID=2014781 RepID=UPI001356505C|nr:RNA methyltransferase [Scatolibacter rhodanostii]